MAKKPIKDPEHCYCECHGKEELIEMCMYCMRNHRELILSRKKK